MTKTITTIFLVLLFFAVAIGAKYCQVKACEGIGGGQNCQLLWFTK